MQAGIQPAGRSIVVLLLSNNRAIVARPAPPRAEERILAQEYIEIRGARENNLKNVSLRIPKRKITIFTGVSGSGKSSIVFDTIATEAQRLLNENFSMFVRNFLPRFSQPDADAIENLSMAIVVDQKRLGGGSHSTVGTITDIAPVLRLLFSRIGQPFIGYSNAFSFNDPQGMCPECNGLGRKMGVNSESFLDMSRSLNEGAVQVPVFSSWERDSYTASGFFDNDKKLADYSDEEMELLLHGKDLKYKLQLGSGSMNATYQGVMERFNRSYIKRDLKTLSERTQKAVAPYLSMQPCPLCKGARLSQAALSCTIEGRNIAELSAMEVGALIEVLKEIDQPVAAPMLATLIERLQHLADIGLEYLSLDRETDSLSGGESQRVKIVKHLSSSLVDVIYIFDEPSVGLHPRDVHRMNELLQKLRDKGNTVIVVEHDPDVIKVADHVVDMGPHAGSQGGSVVYEGSFEELQSAGTLTGRFLQQALPIKRRPRQPTGALAIRNASANNLQRINIDIPAGVLTVVTGVAGSGKSSLINEEFLRQYPAAVVIDQSAVGASTRSNPATYTGIMDDVRKAFASANGVSASLFSFNSKGACENCQGLGVIYTDLAFLDGVKTPCEICGGKRFKDEVLAYTLNGASITDVLEMTVRQALEFFKIKEVVRKLRAMRDVGLDYLSLGQPLSTLSGGECQRIKLASELHKKGSIYVLDEPTTGLHMSDIAHLLEVIDRLVDSGNTVIVIEHNLHVIKNADWIIDMGPEGGTKGGRILFTGTPELLLQAEHSHTSAYLRATSAAQTR
jgi:excinuclease UvrABC ATPase subunit